MMVLLGLGWRNVTTGGVTTSATSVVLQRNTAVPPAVASSPDMVTFGGGRAKGEREKDRDG